MRRRRRFFSFREIKKGKHETGGGGGGGGVVCKRARGRARGSKQLYLCQESCQGGLAQALLNPATGSS